MASIKTDEIKLCLTIDKISELKTLFSSLITLQDLPWKITVFKSTKENKLGFGLMCMGNDEPNWSCAATASVEIQSFNPNHGPLEDSILPYVFDANGKSTSCTNIKWNDLIDEEAGYVQNNKAKVNVRIMARNLKTNNKTVLKIIPQNDMIKAHLTIHEASTLIAASSNEFPLSGLLWKIIVVGVGYRAIDNRTKLSTMLWCASKNTPTKWSRDISGSVSVFMKNGQPKSKGTKKLLKFSEQHPRKFFHDSISWKELMDQENKYISDIGTIVLEFELQPDGRTPQNARDRAGQHGNTSSSQNSIECPTESLCSICFENMVSPHTVSTECGHPFHRTCITTWLVERPQCPLCDRTLTLQQIHPLYLP